MNAQLEPITAHDAERLAVLEQIVRLAVLEQIVKDGKGAFLAVGMALVQIRDDRLYRAEHATFEEYLEKRWDISKSYGYRLIAFAKQVEMSPIGDKPETESQARKSRKQRKALAASRELPSEESKATTTQTADCGDSSEQDPPRVHQFTGDGSESTSEPSPARTNDAKFEAAMGIKAENFYASQIEDIATDAIANATEEQILCAITACKKWAMELKIALARRSL